MRSIGQVFLSLILGLTSAATFGAKPSPTDLEAGRSAFLDRQRGHCLLCHEVTQLQRQAPFQGNLGPDLSEIGRRLSVAQIATRIADPKQFNAQSIMPAYGQSDGFSQIASEYAGKSILTDQEINQVAMYLSTLAMQQPNQ